MALEVYNPFNLVFIQGGSIMVDCNKCLVDSMIRHIGQTVTIFTTSGGLSGSGFSGVLLSADCHCIRLLAEDADII